MKAPRHRRFGGQTLGGIVAIYAAVLAASTGVLVFNLADGKGLPMGAKIPSRLRR